MVDASTLGPGQKLRDPRDSMARPRSGRAYRTITVPAPDAVLGDPWHGGRCPGREPGRLRGPRAHRPSLPRAPLRPRRRRRHRAADRAAVRRDRRGGASGSPRSGSAERRPARLPGARTGRPGYGRALSPRVPAAQRMARRGRHPPGPATRGLRLRAGVPRPGERGPLLRRGFFARVGLEPFGSGIRAHERTLPGPREDRYRLLRATNVNTSPVVAMYEDDDGQVAEILDAVAAEPPSTEAVDVVGDRHRLWMLPGRHGRPSGAARGRRRRACRSRSRMATIDTRRRCATGPSSGSATRRPRHPSEARISS